MARRFRALRKAMSGGDGPNRSRSRSKPMGMEHGRGLLAKEIGLPPSKFRKLSSGKKKRGGGKYA